MEKCKYRLPCGWCDRLNDKCVFEQVCEAIKPSKNQDSNYTKEILDTQSKRTICIHEWELDGYSTGGFHYRCRLCNCTKTEPSVLTCNVSFSSKSDKTIVEEVDNKSACYDIIC